MLDRSKINQLIRQLWIEFSKGEYSEYTEEDLNLWNEITLNKAIQDRLTSPTGAESETGKQDKRPLTGANGYKTD